jgi:hypothetical protein
VVNCGDDPAGPAGLAYVTLARIGGEGLAGAGLSRLEPPLAVRATDSRTGEPRTGAPVRFALERGAASGAALSDTLVATDPDGVAFTTLTLGDGADDTVSVLASLPGRAPIRFSVAVTPAPDVRAVTPSAFRGGDTISLSGSGLAFAAAPGVVRFGDASAVAFGVSDTLVRVVVPPCLPTGLVSVYVASGTARSRSVAAYHTPRETPVVLAPLEGVTLRAPALDECAVLEGAGARYIVIPHFGFAATTPLALDVEVGAGPPMTSFAGAGAAQTAHAVPHAFEARLRARESALAAALPSPRPALRASATSAAIGDLRSFRVISTIDATEFATVNARLAVAGMNVLVWVDTLAPDELSDTTLAAVGRHLDQDLYPLAVNAFGETSDVDGDARVQIVLSPVVNALTPAGFCSLSGFVGAFFSAHDLYPGSPNANGAEVMYGFVPDSTGRFGCPHLASEFARVLPTAFVHEMQHVISYYQHVMRRGGSEEEVWLNEGLSHAAEELASKVYETRYPWPSGRASPEQLFPDSSSSFILFNLVNAYLFLRQPYASSLTSFQEGGTIEERGGAWLFVRWLADQYGEDMLRRLVQTPLRGAANVADKTAVPFSETIGDFAIALYADSIPGLPRESVPQKWRFRSRNWRELFQRLNVIANFPPFPIELLDVPWGGSASGSLRAGGFAFLRVDVPAGEASVTLRFVRSGGEPWLAGHAPRVSVFRLQ